MTEMFARAHDHSQQAILGVGTQHNHFGVLTPEERASITSPLRSGPPLRGRDELLSTLASAWTAPSPRVRVLHGLGGSGKTSIAAETAVLVPEDTDVWWLSATDAEQFQIGVHVLARTLGLTSEHLHAADFPDRLWRRLNAHERRWLLIIDNADDVSVLSLGGRNVKWGTSWLRPVRSSRGLVVVTSRDGGEDTWADWCHLHRVDVLPPEDGAQILLDLTRSRAGDRPSAQRLSTRLGGLPLALHLAGSYLARTSRTRAAFAEPGAVRTFDAYLTALASGTVTLTFPEDQSDQLTQRQVGAVIGQTWQLSLDLLAERGFSHARPLLALLASFAEAPIPYELILSLDVLRTAPPFATLTGEQLWDTLTALESFGLITMADPTTATPNATPLLHLHPLVQQASRPSAPDLLTRSLAETAAQALPEPELPASWPSWEALAPHLFHLLALPTTTDLAPLVDSTNLALRHLIAAGLSRLAETHGRACRTIAAKALGPDHPDALTTRHNIARAMMEQGRHAEAEAEFRQILTIQLRVSGADHPNTLATRHNIAHAMLNQGRHTEAEAEFRQILTVQLRVSGADHPHTLTTRHNIARAMLNQGRHAEAEAELREVLTVELRVLGADHPDSLTTRHNVARAMMEQGRHAEAEAEFREVLTVRLRVSGADHPNTLATRHNIAHVMMGQGRHSEGLAEFQDVLDAYIRVLGPDHPRTRATRSWLT